jgi:type IV fimbrial biogenesis protein FimT
MLVTLCVAALLASVAAPSLGRLRASAQITATARDFVASLRLARSEAVKRGARVVMCKSATGTACAESGGWEQGWLVFHDADGNGRPDTDEAIIQQAQALDPGLLLTGNLPVARAFTFVGRAGSRTPTGALQAGALTLCQRFDAPGTGRQIVVSSGGRVDVRKVAVLRCE